MAQSITAIRTAYQGWCRLLVASVASRGETLEREIEDHGAAVAILPYDPVRRVATLVLQPRIPVMWAEPGTTVLEAVAGVMEETDPDQAARRETLEEVGLRLDALEAIGRVWTMPGLSSERMTLYLAAYRETSRVAAGGGLAAEHEDITVVEVPLATLAADADAGRLNDMKTLALVQSLRLRQPTLFTPIAAAG